MKERKYNAEEAKIAAPDFFRIARAADSVDDARARLSEHALRVEYKNFSRSREVDFNRIMRERDSARALRTMLKTRSEELAGFSVTQAIYDEARGKARPDLAEAFWADLIHVLTGVMGDDSFLSAQAGGGELAGREAAVARSAGLDEIWEKRLGPGIKRFESGLSEAAVARRAARREKILKVLSGSDGDWWDYKWQFRHVVRRVEDLKKLVRLGREEEEAAAAAIQKGLPFGVTPYYLSLMDDEPSGRDRAIRAQVFPPMGYVERVSRIKDEGGCSLDYMLEGETSPIDLVTRRYPSIAIFKPFNACPQICVYCQRNWEIEEPMGKKALASHDKIDSALQWISERESLREVLVTGGDPFGLGVKRLEEILTRLSRIPTVEFIRIGTRALITAPMRITNELADLLGSLREPGKLRVSLVTHAQHAYEITPEVVEAVNRLKSRGVSVYNQMVYTFHVSRRFEAVAVRHYMRLAGADPYYTFNVKGKEETSDYRVPIARLLQEQAEEARLLPGLSRTDEAVFNVPGLGKNYLRAQSSRDLLAIKPNGSRVYEFFPWERNLKDGLDTYVGYDVPILEYLKRLESMGEDPADYSTIWYYY